MRTRLREEAHAWLLAADPYEAPLFPLLRNAQEYLGLGQLVLFFVSGLALGAIENRHPWRLGLTAVSLLPVVALLEVRVDPSSHTLLPLEILFYGAYGLLIGAGVSTSRHWVKRACRRMKMTFNENDI